ncbi:hypothetical protein L596_009774 [Steinernema carpocapsae]|uniref:Uncharacterized protein n=1 Tax=Steinernema carpocapsae TaxID=34508 RepID=A0A4U5PGU4_STECR|nr:hypothetical protein L596_009774 [Steinernema carpocapsae]
MILQDYLKKLFAESPYRAIRDVVVPSISFGLDCFLALHLHFNWDKIKNGNSHKECEDHGLSPRLFNGHLYRSWECSALDTSFIIAPVVLLSFLIHATLVSVLTYHWAMKRAVRQPLKLLCYNAITVAVTVYGYLHNHVALAIGLIFLAIRVASYIVYRVAVAVMYCRQWKHVRKQSQRQELLKQPQRQNLV